jgi:hypothetical protein
MRRCPDCDEPLTKVIYAGLPGKMCFSCSLFMGLASYIAMLFFNGHLLVYEGSYWRALWHWLFHTEESYRG